MTPEDKEFVREIIPWVKAEDDRFEKATYLKWCNRLLTLLIESEGMRMKAEFCRLHRVASRYCVVCDLEKWSEKHNWSDADWIAAARKEIEGE